LIWKAEGGKRTVISILEEDEQTGILLTYSRDTKAAVPLIRFNISDVDNHKYCSTEKLTRFHDKFRGKMTPSIPPA